jgi:Na+/melibiose symporter-like transporter
MTPQVPAKTKLLYGVGELAISVKNITLNQYLLFFYVDVVRVSPVLVGGAIFFGRLWDAVTDPIVGYLSDTTRSRYGRRRPYVLLSALPLGIAFALLFAPPTAGELSIAVYLGVLYVVLMSAFTFFATPYLAWGAELADDPHERTSVVQARSMFGVAGGLLGAVVPMAVVQQFSSERAGFAAMGMGLGLLLTASALVPGAFVPERERPHPPTASFRHFFSGLAQTFANREFRIVFATFGLMTLALSLGNSVQLFVIKYWLGLYEFFPWIAGAFALSFICSFPFWAKLSRRTSKRAAIRFGLLLGTILPLGWFLLSPGYLPAMLAFAACGGFASGAVTVVASAAVDAVDLDEWQTGERREGAYFGVWTLGLKTAAAAGTLLGGFILRAAGFEPTAAPEAERVQSLLWILGPLQALAHLFGLFMLRNFTAQAQQPHELQAALLARRTGATSHATPRG